MTDGREGRKPGEEDESGSRVSREALLLRTRVESLASFCSIESPLEGNVEGVGFLCFRVLIRLDELCGSLLLNTPGPPIHFHYPTTAGLGRADWKCCSLGLVDAA